MGILSPWSQSPRQSLASERDASDLDNPRRIDLPEQITHILQGICNRRNLVTVRLPGCKEPFTSALLKLDRRARMLILDELSPQEGHGLLLQHKELRIDTRHHGVEVGFKTILAGASQEGGIALYRVPIPRSLDYNQRRAHYRAEVGVVWPIPIILEGAEGQAFHGQILDISVGGIGAQFQDASETDLADGARFDVCEIELRPGQSLRTGLEICFVSRAVVSRQLRIGGRFIDLSRADQQTIARFIASLERERLRTLPREED